LKAFYIYLGQKGDTSKGKYFELITYLPKEIVDEEVTKKLDFIQKNAQVVINVETRKS